MEKYAYWKRNKEILLALGLTLGLMAAFKLFGVLVYDTNTLPEQMSFLQIECLGGRAISVIIPILEP